MRERIQQAKTVADCATEHRSTYYTTRMHCFTHETKQFFDVELSSPRHKHLACV